jgi:hypothetical protein
LKISFITEMNLVREKSQRKKTKSKTFDSASNGNQRIGKQSTKRSKKRSPKKAPTALLESPIVKSETADVENQIPFENYDFSSIDELMMTEIIVENFEKKLSDLKRSICGFKLCNNHFRDNFNMQFYDQKKLLITNYIKCEDAQEKERLNERLVSILFKIYTVILMKM